MLVNSQISDTFAAQQDFWLWDLSSFILKIALSRGTNESFVEREAYKPFSHSLMHTDLCSPNSYPCPVPPEQAIAADLWRL